ARERLTPIFGVRASVLITGGPGGAAKPLAVNLQGADVVELQRLADEVLTRMETIPGVVDIESSIGSPRPEYRIDVDRDLANELGLDIGVISSTVRPLLAGETATRWED